MTQLNPGNTPATLSPGLLGMPASSLLPRPTPARHLDLHGLHSGVASRQQEITELEAQLVCACEAAAARNAANGVCIEDRETWDRAMWNRYLAAAAQLEPDYGPRMRRLYQEVDQLKRLAALPRAA